MVLSANGGSHQKWRRNIRARISPGLRGNLRSNHYSIDTERALLDINAGHLDRIFIFESNAEFVRQTNLHWLSQDGIGSVEAQRVGLVGRPGEDCEPAPAETGCCSTSTRYSFARDNQRFARRGLATGSFLGNQAAEKSQEKSWCYCRSE